MRAVFKFNGAGAGAQITTQYAAQNTASGNKPVPVSLEMEAPCALAFGSTKRRRQARQRPWRDAN
jgi:hypothetical protein